MPDEASLDRVVREVSRVLVSIRRALDLPFINLRRLKVDLDEIRRVYLQIEDARFTFNARLRPRRDTSAEGWHDASEELIDNLGNIISDKAARQLLDYVIYRPFSTGQDQLIVVQGRSGEDRITCLLALEELQQFLMDFDGPGLPESKHGSFSTSKLRRILPRPKLAPVQFDVVNNKLVVLSQVANPSQQDIANVNSAKEELVRRGEQIIDELESSNCDRRLLQNVLELQVQLESGNDIIKLGLTNIGCEIMRETFSCELPDAVSAMLRSHNVGINMYVAQFPEWHRFNEQAVIANELREDDVRIISAAASTLINHLRVAPQGAVDPEVPRVLEALNAFLEDPASASKRAAYAVLRSVENLFIRVFHYGADFIDQTASKTVKALSTTAARTIVVALMTAALAGAVTLGPVAAQLPEAAWISKAAEVVKSQIDKLAK